VVTDLNRGLPPSNKYLQGLYPNPPQEEGIIHLRQQIPPGRDETECPVMAGSEPKRKMAVPTSAAEDCENLSRTFRVWSEWKMIAAIYIGHFQTTGSDG
jgi:hypothetical protein